MKLTIVADGRIATVGLVELIFDEPGMGINVQTCTGNPVYEALSAQWKSGNYLLVRTGDYPAMGFVRRLKAAACPYIYYLDDNFWLLLDDTRDHRHYLNPLVRQTLELSLSGASVVICHSERFRDVLLRFNPHVLVVPPHFDFGLIEGVNSQLHREFRIGIVGNASRAEDIAFLVDIVRSVLARAPAGTAFEFFGYTPPELQGLPGVRSLESLKDYKSFIREQKARGWGLALAPLRDTPFAAYKTNNKFREFGACGIAGIYSDTVVYSECVEHGVTGWVLPNEPQAWVEQILAAIKDPGNAERIGMNAREYIRQHHEIGLVRNAWRNAARSAYAVSWPRRLWQRFAESRMRRWDAVPATGQMVLNEAGPQERWLPGEEHGYFRRHMVFELKVAQVIETTIHPLAVGACAFSMTVGTKMQQPTGSLKVEFIASEGADTRLLDLGLIQDNERITFRITARSRDPVRVRVTNEGSHTLAFYMCSEREQTAYPSTGKSFPYGFLA